MIWLLGFIGLFFAALFIVDSLISAPAYKGPVSDHFDGKKFGDSDESKARNLFDIIKWGVSGKKGKWKKLPKSAKKNSTFSVIDDDNMAVTFVNHSTYLIQMDGLNILTDPIWSNRASPYQWIGPKRMRPPGIRFEDLPQIDLVLVSHNHYDHLDLSTVLRLKNKFDPVFVTPLGVGQFLNQHDISVTVHLDWWDKYEFNKCFSVNAVPARHFSGRGVFDRDKTLWCGYVIQSRAGTIYFAGDTAYGDFFSEIGNRFSPIDLAIIPIGAYKPRWFMQPIHVNPEEALKIHLDVQSAQSIGSHFATFPLADEGMNEPLEDLIKAREKYEIPTTDFTTLKEGNTTLFNFSKADKSLAT